MPFTHHFKPTHKEIKRYYEELAGYAEREVVHETAVRSAFQNLLATTCKKADWHLVPEQPTRVRGKQVRPDGTLRDDFNLHRGYWEAKDSGDKLDAEIRKKIALGYPLSNTIFEDTATAVLFQNGVEQEPRYDLTKPPDLCKVLGCISNHTSNRPTEGHFFALLRARFLGWGSFSNIEVWRVSPNTLLTSSVPGTSL